MSLSAAAIIAQAPLGAIVRWNDGSPRPPVRHVRKVRDWERRNGEGRLVERQLGSGRGVPDGFTIHEGDFGEGEVIVLRVRRVFDANTPLGFEIVSVPQPGEALVVTSFAGRDELQRVTASHEAAERWSTRHDASGRPPRSRIRHPRRAEQHRTVVARPRRLRSRGTARDSRRPASEHDRCRRQRHTAPRRAAGRVAEPLWRAPAGTIVVGLGEPAASQVDLAVLYAARIVSDPVDRAA